MECSLRAQIKLVYFMYIYPASLKRCGTVDFEVVLLQFAIRRLLLVVWLLLGSTAGSVLKNPRNKGSEEELTDKRHCKRKRDIFRKLLHFYVAIFSPPFSSMWECVFMWFPRPPSTPHTHTLGWCLFLSPSMCRSELISNLMRIWCIFEQKSCSYFSQESRVLLFVFVIY